MSKVLFLGSKKYPDSLAEYLVFEKDDKIQLNYSITGYWTRPGKPAYALEDTGNGLVFKDLHLNKTVNIDYCQANALRALLKLNDKDSDDTFRLFKQIK